MIVVFPECVSGADKEPEEVSVAAKLPDEATSRRQETKKRKYISSSESEDEVSKDLEGSSGISSHTPCMGESLCCKSGAISAPAFCCNPSKTMGSESQHSWLNFRKGRCLLGFTSRLCSLCCLFLFQVVCISSDSSFVASAEEEDTTEPGRTDSTSFTYSFLLLL